MSDAIFTQRLSADNFPPKGSSNSDGGLRASSTFRYTFVDGDARILTYFTSQSCTLLSIARSLNLSPRNVRSIIQQALCRVNQENPSATAGEYAISGVRKIIGLLVLNF